MKTSPTLFTFRKFSSGVFLFSFFLIVSSSKISYAQCSTVDQSQLNYNGGTSARNLPQYTVWQDFTAGSTGTLCQIDMGFFNAMTGTGVLNIFNGTGTGGTLLQAVPVTVSGTGNFFQSFSVSVPVTSGAVYTFQFIPDLTGGLPDPYGVQIESPGSYAGGQMEITDPSGTYTTGFDLVFKTYVTVSTQISPVKSATNAVSVFPNPVSVRTTLKTDQQLINATLIIRNLLGQEVKTIKNISGTEIIINRDNLLNGIYFIQLLQDGKTISEHKMVITD